MSMIFARRSDGSHEVIHGKGVLQTEEYRGWEIRVHWGGIEGRKFLRGVSLTDVNPARKDLVDRIKEINPRSLRDHNRQQEKGSWVYTTPEPFVHGNRPFNQAMVKRVRKAIDAWEEKAKKKYGIS